MEFSTSAWSEKNFKFDVSKHVGLAKIEFYRDRHIFGSLELGRVVIDDSGFSGEYIIPEKKEMQAPEKVAIKIKKSSTVMQQKANIAIIIPYQIFGGAEIYIGNIINQMCQEHNFTIIYIGRNYLQNYIPSPRVQHRIIKDFEQLSGFLKTHDFDYIIYYNRADIYKLLDQLRLNTEISSRLVEIYHSDFTWPGSLSNQKQRRILDKLIAISPSLALNIENVDLNKRMVIPVGIDLNKFKSDNGGKLKQELGINPKTPVIGTVARLSSEKRIDYVIRLAANLHDYQFVIVGDGPERNKLEQLCVELKVKNVKLVGHKSNVEDYYQIFDGFILASKIEGTPISIIEAMASEVLVFSNFVGAIPDILIPNETGIKISGDLLSDIEIIKNNLFNHEIINKAKQYVIENHDIVKNSEKFFKALISENNFFIETKESERFITLLGEYI